MIYTLKNKCLTVSICDRGAELLSVRRNDNKYEYIWQRDPAHWSSSAPWLFPICSHLAEDRYTWRGKTYELPIHGFARHQTFIPVTVSKTALTLVLDDTPETRRLYPFSFSLSITYRLVENDLEIEASVENTGKGTLPFAFGAHPGFNVPMEGKGSFEDYCLQFGEHCSPDELLLSENGLNTGKKKAYILREGKYLDLKRKRFEADGIFLSRMADSVTLGMEDNPRAVTVFYPNAPYLGIWSKPDRGASFVCIEPWYGLPSFEGEIDDLATKSDLFRLPRGEKKDFSFRYTFH